MNNFQPSGMDISAIRPDYTLCCIGHITLDKVVTPEQTIHMPGGTAFYFAHALACIDTEGFLLVTLLGESEMEVVEDMRKRGLDVLALTCKDSVYFENIYGENRNERRQRVLAKADPFKTELLAPLRSRIFHLGTLLADDFPPEAIRSLSQHGLVAADAQGFLREVRGEQVYPVDWTEKRELLPYIHFLKANEHEMVTLTGSEDPEEAAAILAGWGVREVVLTLGDRGSLILAGGDYHHIPPYPVKRVVDTTGCGDTYMAGYLYCRSRRRGIDYSGRYAAAMCSLKLARTGPFASSEEEILALMHNGNLS